MDQIENWETLFKKYPVIYKNCRWVSCNTGWYKLIDETSRDIEIVLGYNKWYNRIRYLYITPVYNTIVGIINSWLWELPIWMQKKTAIGFCPYVRLPYLEEATCISDIKEKYGTLRIYTNYSHDIVDKLISYAETQSEHTCEECGEYGELSGFSWLNTWCEKHRTEKGVMTYEASVKEYNSLESNVIK